MAINSQLSACTANYDLVIFDEVDSTNSELCRQLASNSQLQNNQSGEKHGLDLQPSRKPLAVVAYSQTAGRGRLGRNWQSLPGGVYLSMNLELSEQSQKNAALSLVVALGVFEALEGILKSGSRKANIQIKWPNDIVCPSGKLAGILLETNAVQQHATPEAMVGVGINVKRPSEAFAGAAYLLDLWDFAEFENSPSEFAPALENSAPDLETRKRSPQTLPTLQEVAESVITNILTVHQLWQQAGYSFSPFVQQYNNSLSIMGRSVKVSDINGSRIASGIVQGVDAGGRLLVQNNGVNTAVFAGDVTLR